MNQDELAIESQATVAPELLKHFIVITHNAVVNSTNPDPNYDARISAVGIGPVGVEMVQMLSQNLRVVICHEVINDPAVVNSMAISELIPNILESDLLFIMSDLDDAPSLAAAQVIGHAARKAGILTIALTSNRAKVAEMAAVADTVFTSSSWSLTGFAVANNSLHEDATRRYALRHAVTVITRIITEKGVIGVDFADITTVINSGNFGGIGVGIASGNERGSCAAKTALDQLVMQTLLIEKASGVLVCIQASSLSFTMSDFDEVNKLIHERIQNDANVIIGCLTDDKMGQNIKVTVMPVYQ